MNQPRYISLFLSLAAVLFITCSDTPRDNPFDPGSEVLIVEVISPPAGRAYTTGHPIVFEVAARTGYDNLPAGDTYLWKSDVSGILSDKRKFTASLPAANHRIQVTVKDSLGRGSSRSFDLTIRSADQFGVELVLPSVDTAFVVGTAFEPLVAEYVPAGSSVIGRLWDFGAGSGIPQSTLVTPGLVTFSVPGFFPVSYRIVDQQGRVAADTVIVEVVVGGDPPIAGIISPATDTVIEVGDSLYLQAEAVETAARIVSTGWIYPEGSGLENRQDTLETPGWVKFRQPGVFPLRFLAGDRLGITSEDTVTVTVNDTLPPPAGSIAAPARDTSLVTGDSLYFSGNIVPAGLPNLTIFWSWGAGSGLAVDSVLVPGWKKFNAPGAFTVVFNSYDASGRGVPDSLRVTVTANQPPAASIVNPPGNVAIGVGSDVDFTATDSDPEGRHLNRFWLWETLSGIQPSVADTSRTPGTRSFDVIGNFRVVYLVTDDKGLATADTITVSVTSNDPPVAQITAPSADTTVYAWVPVTFRGTDSDPDGTVATRHWDFGAPGMSAAGDDTRNPDAVAFAAAGIYKVVYSVVDNKNARGADTLSVTVNSNQRPIAYILSPGGNISISAGDSISFLGQEFDGDGSIANRIWTYGTGSGLTPDLVSIPDYRKFAIQGVFEVVFQVTDNRGAVAADTLVVTVTP